MEKAFIKTEIGSEFWSIPARERHNSLFPADTRWFISGTSALEYLLADIQATTALKRVGVPSWCCSCMIQPFINAGLTVVFYPVYADENGHLVCDYEAVADCDATLILSYFGYDALKTVGRPGGILIRDLTHSLFCRSYDDAQYYFGSLRKWAGFWTGGYVRKAGEWHISPQVPPADEAYLRLRSEAMAMKLDYLKGRRDGKEYLALFEEAEDYLDRGGITGSCERDIFLASHLDIDYIKARRRENARALLARLRKLALFPELGENDCPLFVPILLPNRELRDRLRRHLIAAEIYCPVHWPVSEWHVLGAAERELYDRSLSLVCDQRYDEADMARIADAITAFLEE